MPAPSSVIEIVPKNISLHPAITHFVAVAKPTCILAIAELPIEDQPDDLDVVVLL